MSILKTAQAALVLIVLLAGCASDRPTAIVNVNLIPMTGEIVVPGQTVLIEGDRITAIGAAGSLSLPRACIRIEGNGAFLVPGLADMHMHTRENWSSSAWPVSPLRLFLANGVTTIRDFSPRGESNTYALKWRKQIGQRKLDGPAIYASGVRLFESPLDNPAALVQWNHAQGFDFLKIYSYVSRQDFQAALAEAKALNFYTAGHIPYPVGLDGCLAAGMDEIAHVEELDFEFIKFDRNRRLSSREWLPYVIGRSLEQTDVSRGFDEQAVMAQHGQTLADIAARLKAADVPVCTTMSVGSTIVRKLFRPDVFLAQPEVRYLPAAYRDAFRRGQEKHQQQFKGIEALALFKYDLEKLILKTLHQAGVTLLLSTDCGTGGMGIVPGFSLHDELRILVENGFTPYEAMAAGTVNAARVVARMTGKGDFGTIVVGKKADLILVPENPLENIDRLRNIRGVMAAGKWYSKSQLDEMIVID